MYHNTNSNKKNFLSTKFTGLLSIIAATMLLVLNLQDGSVLRAVLVGIVLYSGIRMMMKQS